jgi:O-methyltransferase
MEMIPQQTAVAAHPAAALSELMFPSVVRCISVAAQYDVAELLAAGPRDLRELAAQSRTDPRSLGKVLRLLAEEGIFMEVDTEVFANTPLSECLRRGVPGSLHSMARMVGEPWLWACWGRLDFSVATGAPAFDEVFGTSTWAWFAQNPGAARLFNDAMSEFSDALSSQLVQAYPDFAAARVVADLGGGLGSYLAAILGAYPAVGCGVLVDLPAVIEQARERPELAALAAQGRYRFAPGDFFAAVPGDVDIYVTKQIMHSWQDDQVVRVLERCRGASPGARVVAAELVHHPGAARFVKNFDLVMLVTMSGSVRTEAEFAELFRRAGYRLGAVTATQTAFSLIEALPA